MRGLFCIGVFGLWLDPAALTLIARIKRRRIPAAAFVYGELSGTDLLLETKFFVSRPRRGLVARLNGAWAHSSAADRIGQWYVPSDGRVQAYDKLTFRLTQRP